MFYDKFVSLCTEKGLSKQAVCASAGLSSAAWVRWKDGSIPNSVSLKKLCDYLGVTTESMLTDHKPIEYVTDADVARQDVFKRAEMRILFDAAKDVPASKIYEVVSILQKFKEESDASDS